MINSRETELSILGSVMVDATILPRVVSYLQPEDFFYGDTRKVYHSMINLYSNGVEINVKTVWNELYKQNYEDLTETELREWLDYRVGGDTVMSFVTQIAEFSGYRLLEEEVTRLAQDVENRNYGLTDYAGRLTQIATSINAKGLRQDIVTGPALIEEYLEMIARPKSMFAFTGLPHVDEEFYDFNAKEITYLAARPGTGKTAMLLQSARKNLEKGIRVGFLSMEMERAKLINRMLASRSKTDGSKMLKMSQDEFLQDRRLTAALDWFATQPLFIDDTGPWNNVTVPQKIRKLVYEHGCQIVYVDYIGLIGAVGHLSSSNRNNQLSEISRSLKELATELSIPILIASQLNREVAKRTDGRPTLADLRDSGALEQDASIVAFLYHDLSSFLGVDLEGEDLEEYFKEKDIIEVKFEIQKQRNGPTFLKNLVFEKPMGLFNEKTRHNATYDTN